MVYRRELNEEELTLGNQGALYGGALTLWDHGTGSVWSQITGEAIVGPLTGARLELVPSVLTDWATWRRTHPHTLALDADGGTAGFDVDDTYIVVEFGDDVLAVPVEKLRGVGVANTVLSGVPVAVVAEEAPGGWWGVYSRQLGDRVVTLDLDGRTLIERDGPGRWEATRGVPDIEGSRLDPLGAFTIFPEDFGVHFPQGNVWSPEHEDR